MRFKQLATQQIQLHCIKRLTFLLPDRVTTLNDTGSSFPFLITSASPCTDSLYAGLSLSRHRWNTSSHDRQSKYSDLDCRRSDKRGSSVTELKAKWHENNIKKQETWTEVFTWRLHYNISLKLLVLGSWCDECIMIYFKTSSFSKLARILQSNWP